jgi:hypothetical protein
MVYEIEKIGWWEMDSLFVATSFHDPDRALVDEISSIITALGMQPVAGRNAGGEQLEQAIEKRIEDCDGLVALFTKRNEGDGWPTHPWVMGEFGHAVTKKKPAIAIVDNEINWSSTKWAGRERIALDRALPAKAMMLLMRELSEWKRNAGITLTAILTTVDVLKCHWEHPERFAVRYRTVARAKPDEYRTTNSFYRDGQAFVINLPGIPTQDHLVEMEVSCGQKKWRSTAVRQLVPVELIEVVDT